MKTCRITFQLLLDYHEGRVDEKTSLRIRRHMASGCRGCQREMAWILDFMPVVPMALHMAEPQVSEYALACVRNLMVSPSRTCLPPSPLQQLAHLIFDSRLGGARLAPVREATRQAVHVVYRAGEIDVDVWQERMGEGELCLIGQALPIDGSEVLSPQQVTLLSAQQEVQTASIEDGEFVFESVPAGSYTLRLGLTGREIVVPDLAVGVEARA